MSASPAGNRMTADQPRLSVAEAAALASMHFGLAGRFDPLTSERDQNFRLTAADGQVYVFKIANAAEPHEVTNFQTEALAFVARSDPGLPVQRVIAADDGRLEIPLASGSIVRLLTWLDGTPLHAVARAPALRRDVGATAARLTRALEGFRHPADGHDLIWDIRNAARLRPLLMSVPEPELRGRCATALDRFDEVVAPALSALPWQVVHADFNPHNLLVDPTATRITGILDFGDMVRTPRICDLAVAASYQIDPGDPLTTLCDVVLGWHSVLPLLPGERVLIPDLVMMRMVTSIVLSNWRAARQPENAVYFLRNLPASRAGFDALTSVDRADALARLDAVLEKDAT